MQYSEFSIQIFGYNFGKNIKNEYTFIYNDYNKI